MVRVFEDNEAKRGAVPYTLGLIGPSNSGKTYSALRLATGMQRVTGGDIWVIDTEVKRALHYAGKFKFRHVPFESPYGPTDYLAAVNHCVSKGARIIVIDSFSHEHEGVGGVLDMFEEEFKRLGEKETVRLLAWQKPKRARFRLIDAMVHMNVHFLLCLRAKHQVKPKKRNESGEAVRDMGYVAITGEELLFEMPLRFLLMPGANGVPKWDPTEPGERLQPRLPEQFKPLFASPQPLCEEHGQRIAEWASGTKTAMHVTDAATFRGRRDSEWFGRPLLDAPLSVLQQYGDAVREVIKNPGERSATSIEQLKTHLADVDEALRTKEAEAPNWDMGQTGPG